MGTEATGARRWRKIAGATWGSPHDPQIYGDLEIDAERLLAFVEDARRATDARVTVTHLVGRAVAFALAERRDLNVRYSRGRFVPRESIDIFFVVALPGGDLSGVKVREADRKPVVEIANELSQRAQRMRAGSDEFGATKKLFAVGPTWLLRPLFRLGTWLTTDLNLDLKRWGLPRQAFGSAMVTSVGMFGIQHAYAPLSPYFRIPFLVLVSEVTIKPVVVDREIVARPRLTISATIDHRYVDGAQAASLARSVRTYLDDPAAHEPPLVSAV